VIYALKTRYIRYIIDHQALNQQQTSNKVATTRYIVHHQQLPLCQMVGGAAAPPKYLAPSLLCRSVKGNDGVK